MARERVLVVDDEEPILELVEYNLAKAGYFVTRATTGEDALRLARSEPVDLVLLDLMLPGVDGLEVCKILTSDDRTRHIPIVMLTARGEEPDIVAGLEIGADDYVVKPFSPRVLLARVKAALRKRTKATAPEGEPVRVHDLVIDPGRRMVTVDGRPVDLTFTEFGILHTLASRPGWVFTRYQIVETVRGDDYAVTERAVDVQIVALRKKLGKSGAYIETVRGVGYRLKE